MSMEGKGFAYDSSKFYDSQYRPSVDSVISRVQCIAFARGGNAIVDAEIRDTPDREGKPYMREFFGTIVKFTKENEGIKSEQN